MGFPVPGRRTRWGIALAAWLVVVLVVLTPTRDLWLLPLTMGRAIGIGAAAVAVVLVVFLFVIRPARRRGGLVPPTMQVATSWRPVGVPELAPPPPIQACMRCGSLDLATPGLRDGVWLGGGELQFLVCRNCNSRSPPLTFDRAEDYVAFVRELHEPAGS